MANNYKTSNPIANQNMISRAFHSIKNSIARYYNRGLLANGNHSNIQKSLKKSYLKGESNFFEFIQLMTPHQIEEFYENIMECISLDKTPPKQLVLLLERLPDEQAKEMIKNFLTKFDYYDKWSYNTSFDSLEKLLENIENIFDFEQENLDYTIATINHLAHANIWMSHNKNIINFIETNLYNAIDSISPENKVESLDTIIQLFSDANNLLNQQALYVKYFEGINPEDKLTCFNKFLNLGSEFEHIIPWIANLLPSEDKTNAFNDILYKLYQSKRILHVDSDGNKLLIDYLKNIDPKDRFDCYKIYLSFLNKIINERNSEDNAYFAEDMLYLTNFLSNDEKADAFGEILTLFYQDNAILHHKKEPFFMESILLNFFESIDSTNRLECYNKYLDFMEKKINEENFEYNIRFLGDTILLANSLSNEEKNTIIDRALKILECFPKNQLPNLLPTDTQKIASLLNGLETPNQNKVFSYFLNNHNGNNDLLTKSIALLDKELVFKRFADYYPLVNITHSSNYSIHRDKEDYYFNYLLTTYKSFTIEEIEQENYTEMFLKYINIFFGTEIHYTGKREKYLINFYKNIENIEKLKIYSKMIEAPSTRSYYLQRISTLFLQVFTNSTDTEKLEAYQYIIQVLKKRTYENYREYLVFPKEMKIFYFEEYMKKASKIRNLIEIVLKAYLEEFTNSSNSEKIEIYEKVLQFLRQKDFQHLSFKKDEKERWDSIYPQSTFYYLFQDLFKFLPADIRASKFSDFLNEDREIVANLFSLLDDNKEKANAFYNILATGEKSIPHISQLLSSITIADVIKLCKNISLTDDFIQKIIETNPNISIKALLFCKDINTEKLEALSQYEQLNTGDFINISSIFSNFALKKLSSKDEFNQFINDIYNLFTYKNLPEFLKTFRIFQLSNFYDKSNDFIESYKNKPLKERDELILKELFIISLNSNNPSLRKFITILQLGKQISGKLQNKPQEQIKKLSKIEIAILSQYRDTLFELHNLIHELKNNERPYLHVSDNIINDLNYIVNIYSKGNKSSNHVFNISLIFQELFSGLTDKKLMPKTLLNYMDKIGKESNTRHILISEKLKNNSMRLEVGDYVKGIKNFNSYFPRLIRSFPKCGEFNQEFSHSDSTPLDLDFGYISSENIGHKTDYEDIATTISATYGQTWIVLKNYDERLRKKSEIKYDELELLNYEPEVYSHHSQKSSRQDRYVKTGIPLLDIDYIVTAEWQPRFGYDMAMAGVFIPVVDTDDKLIFSYEDYTNIREKMAGLSEYGSTEYTVDEKTTDIDPLFETYRAISSHNDTEIDEEIEIIKQLLSGKSDSVSKAKKEATLNFLINFFKQEGITVSNNLSHNLSPSSVELIDTGSTGRGTNIPRDGDFDFFLRHNLPTDVLDRLQKYVESTPDIAKKSFKSLSDGFRAKNIVLPTGEVVDIDITYGKKDLDLDYTSDLCVQDRLETIRRQNPEKYNYVIANIIMAKKILKSLGLYKKKSSDGATEYGGFGGIGVENWILQNGGSFAEAIDSFLKTANNVDDFNKFIIEYPIFDFGSNHRGNMFIHDRFSSFINGTLGFEYAKSKFSEIQELLRSGREKTSKDDTNKSNDILPLPASVMSEETYINYLTNLFDTYPLSFATKKTLEAKCESTGQLDTPTDSDGYSALNDSTDSNIQEPLKED